MRLREVFGAEGHEAARERAGAVIERLAPTVPKVAELLEGVEEDLLVFYRFPAAHWPKLRSTDPLERVNREVGRRSDVVGIISGESGYNVPANRPVLMSVGTAVGTSRFSASLSASHVSLFAVAYERTIDIGIADGILVRFSQSGRPTERYSVDGPSAGRIWTRALGRDQPSLAGRQPEAKARPADPRSARVGHRVSRSRRSEWAQAGRVGRTVEPR